MININKFPVIIFAGARTGSSALGEYISKKYNLVYFNEPDMRPDSWMIDFINYSQTSNSYIVKLMGDRIIGDYYPPDIIKKILSDNCYRIKISRKNKVEQIASFYIAKARDRWVYTTHSCNEYEVFQTNPVTILNDDIKFAVTYLDKQQKILDGIESDILLYYEDLPILDTSYDKTPQPSNYIDLIEAIKKFKLE